MKTYRPWDTDRAYLMPPATRDWLPAGHLAWFILEVVEALDMTVIEAKIHEKDPRGNRPFDPRMMLALLVYGYCTGVYSSRKIARATWTDVAMRVIAAESHPHFTTINEFRLLHLDAMRDMFRQILALCERAGMVALSHVAVDGTRIQANASKHKAMSYERMKETEKRLQSEVDALLARAEAEDKEEDATFGKENDGAQVSEELARRQTRKAKIQRMMEELKQEAAAALRRSSRVDRICSSKVVRHDRAQER